MARVTPEDKLRIARVLQERGHVVAMTGDGVNDGPALRQADIGVAMGASGTDVARDAADLVLLDDHFATIVAAVELGRATYANIRRFLTYHLTDNVAELIPFAAWAITGVARVASDWPVTWWGPTARTAGRSALPGCERSSDDGRVLKSWIQNARVVVPVAMAAGAALAAIIAFLVAGTADPASQGDAPKPAGGPWAAPYLYLGTSRLSVAQAMTATGVRRFTLAFVVSGGGCDPVWDGGGQLAGGAADAVIREIRAAGGDVAVSFGGMGGAKLGVTCSSPGALAGAYQKVIAAYRLRAIDLDAEDTEISSAPVRQRMVDALLLLRQRDPGLWISVTIGAEPTGPDTAGRDLIGRAAAAGLRVDAWTIMPFDFAVKVPDMGRASVQAAEGLKTDLMNVYREPAPAAYQAMGISSMNGHTDTGETITVADFAAMLRYAQAHHLARFAFWSVNRDQPCAPGATADSCSGIDQARYAFTRIIAGFRG